MRLKRNQARTESTMQRNAPQTNHACALAKTLGALPRSITAIVLACALSLPLVIQGLAAPEKAQGVTTEIDAEPDALQQKIEKSATEYDQAAARAAELEKQIADNEARIKELETKLPEQQEHGAEAMRTLYKMQRNTHSLIELVLNASDFNDFLAAVTYIELIQRKNTADIELTKTMQDELKSTKTSLDEAKAQVDNEKQRAEEALRAAQEAREEAQRKAVEAAEAQAAAARAAQEAEAARQAEEAKKAEEAAKDKPAEQPPSTPPSGNGPSEPVSPPPSSDIDWGTDKTAFVNEWTPRIDAYLAGSPLAGQGKTFAAASWDYGVDPRWSPAISNTESSKGRYCFQPHNAWGWGNVSWDSWEEAINSHVRGLARGYGYTISVEAAKKYCPPNWEHWYNATVAQMEMI